MRLWNSGLGPITVEELALHTVTTHESPNVWSVSVDIKTLQTADAGPAAPHRLNGGDSANWKFSLSDAETKGDWMALLRIILAKRGQMMVTLGDGTTEFLRLRSSPGAMYVGKHLNLLPDGENPSFRIR